jgi:hypothetical protein
MRIDNRRRLYRSRIDARDDALDRETLEIPTDRLRLIPSCLRERAVLALADMLGV